MKLFKLKYVIPFLVIIISVAMLFGIYTLKTESGEKAILTRFGRYVKTVEEAGLHWHIPLIENVEIVKCDIVRSIELGYRSQGTGNNENPQYFSVPEESLMITGDENLVHTETAIQYRVSNARDFVFSAENPINSLKIAAESSVRRVVANHRLDDVLTDQKALIQGEIREDLQNICNEYNLGIEITKVSLQAVYAPSEVQDAFDDVIKAREDMNRFINEAKKEANEILPAAEATASEMINKANAYREKRISEAKGDVENFKQILENYSLGPRVTRSRMYLETMQKILPKAKIYIMNDKGDTLRFLPLEDNNSSGS